MRFLLDTNAWIWLFSDPGRIRPEVLALLNQESEIGLSPMSVIEVAQKAAKGRLVFEILSNGWVWHCRGSGCVLCQ